MACAHSIDVVLLHQQNVLLHPLGTHHISAVGVNLMPVDPLYQYRLAIDQKLAVFYLHLPETHFQGNALQGLSLAVFQGGYQGVEIRCLGSPCVYILDDGFTAAAYGVALPVFEFV